MKKILFVPAVRVLLATSNQNGDFKNGKEISTATSTGFEVDIATATSTVFEVDIATATSTVFEVDIATATSTGFEVDIATATSTGFDVATGDLSDEANATSEVLHVNNATFNASQAKSGFIFLLQTDKSTWRK